MCGIAGVLGPRGNWDPGLLLDKIRHRGPDGEGAWVGEQCSLVHSRLAILDPSSLGAQPMRLVRSADGELSVRSGEGRHSGEVVAALVFNGEIYNRDELSGELLDAGVELSGTSDTEVLLRHLFLSGKSVLKRLAGMFAFCFWLPASGSALLAVDRFGIKPLYFARGPVGSLGFASEARALSHGLESAKLDPAAVRDYLMWGSVSAPRGLLEGLEQLRPGSCLEWSSGGVEIHNWVEPRGAGVVPRTNRGPVTDSQRVRLAVEESISRHLLSDVPVGIFLSGGIDSTAILGVARRLLGPKQEIHTFSMGSDSPELDESSLARRTAEHFGTVHHEWVISAAEARDEFRGYASALDLPTIDGFNTWCVSKFVRAQGFKVALSGVGGDEFFGGYPSFGKLPTLLRARRGAGPLSGALAAALDRASAGSKWRRLGEVFSRGPSPLSAYHAIRGIFTEAEARLLAIKLTGDDPGPAEWTEDGIRGGNSAQLVSDLEVTRYMASQLLRDTDVFSMRHGLEVRVPLVDTRLGAELDALDPAFRFRAGKRALVEAVPEIPSWVIEHPKMGFRFPFEDWVDDLLEEKSSRLLGSVQVAAGPWFRRWALALLLPWTEKGAGA